MKKEQLLKNLETTELPELLVVGHKERLKHALLEGVQLDDNTGKQAAAQGDGSGLGGLWHWLRGSVLRTALASTLSLVVIGILLAAAMYFARPSPAVVAADIVKRDAGIQQKLSGAGEIIIVRVEIHERMASVVCGRSMGDFIEADVDVDGRTVVSTRRFEGVFMPEISSEAQDMAIKIARNEATVKALLDKGADVGRVFPVFSSIQGIAIVNGNLVKVTPTTAQAAVPIILENKVWLVQINLQTEKIERIIEPQSRKTMYFDIYYMLQQT